MKKLLITIILLGLLNFMGGFFVGTMHSYEVDQGKDTLQNENFVIYYDNLIRGDSTMTDNIDCGPPEYNGGYIVMGDIAFCLRSDGVVVWKKIKGK